MSKNIHFYSAIFLFFSILQSRVTKQNKCRALALEGGGDAGAWEAGIIQGIIENLPSSEVQYDVISGVSVGSVNGYYLSTFEKGQEQEAAKSLYDYWFNLQQSEIYKNWGYFTIPSIIKGFFSKPAMFNNEPFIENVKKMVNKRKIIRKLTVAVSDATNVKVNRVDLDKEQDSNKIVKSIVASTSMPFIFPYQTSKDSILVDGGVLLNIDIESAVRRCKEIVNQESDIIVDVILPTGAQIQKLDPKKEYTGWQMYKRYKQIVSYKNTLDDLIHAVFDFPDIKIRYIFMPLEPIPSYSIPIQFSNKKMRQMLEIGRKDAKKIINNPNLISFFKKIKKIKV